MIGIKTSTLRAPARAVHAPRTVVRAEPINPDIKKDEPKVVDMVSTDDMPKKFPNCDGSHMAFNKDTGDNVGPLIVTKSE